ncbi:MAG TPA: hypothetical protein VF196_05390 [Casimicrobiaceae bacterium]
MPYATTKGWRFRAAAYALALAVTAGVPVAAAQTVQCPGNACDVTVKVEGDPARPTITVSAQELRMKKGAANPVITWKLVAPAGFEFRQASISPHTGAPTGRKGTTTQAEWDDQCTRLNTSGTEIRIRNRNTKATTLFYNVTVFNAAGRAFPIDPAIVNDP